MKQNQLDFQREALSLLTPRDELFARWNNTLAVMVKPGFDSRCDSRRQRNPQRRWHHDNGQPPAMRFQPE
jgi:hypothetical protein